MNVKGYVFGWSVPTYVDAQTFERAVSVAGGFDRSYTSSYHAKRYAARVRAAYLASVKDGSDLFLRRLKREGDLFRYALVLEKPDRDPVHEQVVVIFHLGGSVGVDYVHPHFPIAESALRNELQHALQYICSASVAATMARHIVRRGAVALRKGGGAYFVPAALEELLEYVQSVVSALGGDTMKFGVTGLEFEQEAIFEAFRESFHAAMTELNRRALEAKRQKTMDRITAEFERLLEIGELYRDILDVYREQVDSVIRTAKRGLISTLGIDASPSHTSEPARVPVTNLFHS